jgi:4-hydroxy 2-oxovalerate aldolase
MTHIIRLAVFDFDGVFTDGNVFFDHKGEPMKKYNTRDAVGLSLLRDANIKIAVVSGYKNNESQRSILEHLKFDYVSLDSTEKLETIRKLADDLNLNLEQVAFMGDDLNDVEALSAVGYSGCPKNSCKECLEVADYISTKNGGTGCIRDFCEEILKRTNKTTVSGLICVKYNSTRLPFKNIRKFGNTTLLDLKIDMLLSLDFLNEVIVNTESEFIIDYVKKHHQHKRLIIVKRDPLYSTDEVDNREFAREVVSNISNEYVLYSPVTMPFIRADTYRNMYDVISNNSYDSVVLIADGKQGGGHKHEKHKFCFGASMMKVSDVEKYGDFIGDNPYFPKCESKERIDIDYPHEFETALYHYFNEDAIYGQERADSMTDNSLYKLDEISPIDEFESTSDNDTDNRASNRAINRVKVIDVTIRDGGFDNHWNWDKNDVINMLRCASDTGIDYFEIGYLVNEDILGKNDGHYRNVSFDTIDEIYDIINPKCKISVLIDYWRYDIGKMPPREDTKVDLIRVVTYMDHDKLVEAIEVCRKAKEKGYETSLNIMCASYFNDDILSNVKEQVNKNKEIFDFLYFADSYGAMEPDKVKYVFSQVQDIRQSGINIGFHIHNNGQIGMANMIASLDYVDIIDGSYNGMGRGMGNVRLEDVILYLIIKRSYDLDIEPFLSFVEDNFKNDEEILDDIRNTLLGFLNIHPYRVRDFPDTSLIDFYNGLIDLPFEKKYDYKI